MRLSKVVLQVLLILHHDEQSQIEVVGTRSRG